MEKTIARLELEVDFSQKKEEYRTEFALQSLMMLLEQVKEDGLYLENKEFADFYAKVEMIKDMLINL
jgi:hypothetical protein